MVVLRSFRLGEILGFVAVITSMFPCCLAHGAAIDITPATTVVNLTEGDSANDPITMTNDLGVAIFVDGLGLSTSVVVSGDPTDGITTTLERCHRKLNTGLEADQPLMNLSATRQWPLTRWGNCSLPISRDRTAMPAGDASVINRLEAPGSAHGSSARQFDSGAVDGVLPGSISAMVMGVRRPGIERR